MGALDALRGFLKGLSEGPVSIEPRFGKRDALGRFVLVSPDSGGQASSS